MASNQFAPQRQESPVLPLAAILSLTRHHRHWLTVGLVGLVLWVATVVVTALTQNVNLLPTVILLGSFLGPVTGVLWAIDHDPSEVLTLQRVVTAFAVGGILGVLAASLLESWLLPAAGPFQYLAVGLIEELVKGLALLAICWRLARFVTRDGFVLGAAVGFGFAAFESSGYALVSLLTPQGFSLLGVVETEVLRGLLAPVGHGLWTAILGGAIFSAASQRGRIRVTWLVAGAYLLVSVLHTLWDSMQGITIALLGPAGPIAPYLALYWGGLALVAVAGVLVLVIAVLRSNRRRATSPDLAGSA